MSDKIQVGYGSGGRGESTKKNLYGKQRTGKRRPNGGFNGAPTVGFSSISDERWDMIDWSK